MTVTIKTEHVVQKTLGIPADAESDRYFVIKRTTKSCSCCGNIITHEDAIAVFPHKHRDMAAPYAAQLNKGD